MNICEHLTATARIYPNRDAIRFDGTSLTYAQLDRRSVAASQRLEQAGIGAGDRVSIMLPNVPAFAVWYYAALRIGAIAVSVSTRSAASEVAYFIKDSGAILLVCDESPRDAGELPCPVLTTNDIGDCRSVVPTETHTSDDQGSVGDSRRQSEIHSRDHCATDRCATIYNAHPNAPAAILYTSGTTGFAKGATLSHMNVRSNVHAFNHLCNQRPDDVILLAVPLFHCFGQNALLNSALNVGATLVLQRKFDLNESKRLIAERRADDVSVVSGQLRTIRPGIGQLLLQRRGDIADSGGSALAAEVRHAHSRRLRTDRNIALRQLQPSRSLCLRIDRHAHRLCRNESGRYRNPC